MTVDIFERCQSYESARTAREAGLYPYFTMFAGRDATTARVGDRDVIMCGSNNYLGLTSDERVRAAARAAIDEYGSSRTGSRLLNGNTPLHEELERELADFFGTEAALVFPTGHQTNLGVIGALPSRHDVVIIDREAHASIYDATRLSPAKTLRFAHNDVADLERVLLRCPPDAGKLVVVDGVYSMGGDLCPLPELVETCRRHGARLVVDDAHGVGVLSKGRGAASHFGVAAEVDLITITFSKALASIGGAVLGSAVVIDYLRHNARSQIFSAAAPPAAVAAALEALRIVRVEPWLCQQAIDNATYVRRELGRLGFATVPGSAPIVSVQTGDLKQTLVMWRMLLETGVYVNAVIPPAASPRLRASFMATHTQEQLDRTLEAFVQMRSAPGEA